MLPLTVSAFSTVARSPMRMLPLTVSSLP